MSIIHLLLYMSKYCATKTKPNIVASTLQNSVKCHKCSLYFNGKINLQFIQKNSLNSPMCMFTSEVIFK